MPKLDATAFRRRTRHRLRRLSHRPDSIVFARALRLFLWLVVAWYVMAISHELGHVVCGLCCGGRLTVLELRPWHLPYSIFDPDPCPLARLWGGPILGVLVPLSLACGIRRREAWLVASFCALANGVYLAAGWAVGDRFLDTPQLLSHGARPAALFIYCAATIISGYIGFRRQVVSLLRGSPQREIADCTGTQMHRPASKKGDLSDPRALYAKGGLFLALGILAGALVLAEAFSWRRLILWAISVWAFCRAYYFVFYVIEHYIDPGYRFAGLIDFCKYCLRTRDHSQEQAASNKTSESSLSGDSGAPDEIAAANKNAVDR